MKNIKLLLLSNSANRGEDYLAYARDEIISFLGNEKKNILFFPFAAVTVGFNEYENLVADRLDKMGEFITTSIHRFDDYNKAVEDADAFIVGGGNTYMLLHSLQKHDLLSKIRRKVLNGTPYIGWSAGANLCCPSIRTTNDMPIIWPKNPEALDLIPFQINPHYIENVPDDYAGESREMRLREFIEVNPGINIVALPEGTLLRIENGKISLKGKKKIKIVGKQKEMSELIEGEDLSFLL